MTCTVFFICLDFGHSHSVKCLSEIREEWKTSAMLTDTSLLYIADHLCSQPWLLLNAGLNWCKFSSCLRLHTLCVKFWLGSPNEAFRTHFSDSVCCPSHYGN